MNLRYFWKWELWPYWLFYVPVYVYYGVLALRSGSLSFVTAANPGMRNGGFVDYPKHEILRHVDPALLPKTIYFERIDDPESVLREMERRGIRFPIILKPDRGERGWNVKKIEDRGQMAEYMARISSRILLQELVDYPREYGVMYARLPGRPRGRVTSVVMKEPVSVVGDGRSTLGELIRGSERGRLHWKLFSKRFARRLGQVPSRGETVSLVEFGTHSLGATFRSGNHLIGPELTDVFDRVSRRIPGFYFGRYDVKAPSFEELLRGNFKIIEINGANSEPTHIYDPDNRLLTAYRDLLAHWRLLCRVSRINLSRGKTGVSFLSLLHSVQTHLRRRKRLSV